MKKFYYLIVLLLILCIGSSYADRRFFGRSYLAYTLPAGGFEFELWNTGRIGKDVGYYYRFQPCFEFEYGVADRFSASLYFNFDQTIAENNSFESKVFDFSSTSLELRYRFTNPGDFIVDPGIYFEFAYGGNELEYESKIILSRWYGRFITTLNLTSEIERDIIESKNESSFEITGGAMYEVASDFAAGLEFRNHREFESLYEDEENQATFIGPTVNYQGNDFYITFNFIVQVAGSPETKNNLELVHHERYEFRTILGIEL